MTDKELKDLVASLAIFQNETGKQIRELKISQNETNEQMKRTDEQMKRTNEQMKKTDERLNKQIKLQRKDHEVLYWMWVTQWNISENIFSENIEEILTEVWKEITRIDKNVKKPWKVEIDLVCLNWTEAFVVEVKTKLTQKHVDKFVNESLPRLRKYFRKYDKYKIYGMVAWRTLENGVEEYATDKWLYVIKERHNWKAKMLSKKDFKPKEYILSN